MIKLYRLTLLIASNLILFLPSSGQITQADTAFIRASADHAQARHEAKTRSQSPLYNGSHYIDYNSFTDETPYFMTEEWTSGSVIYDGSEYLHVSILYNIYTDKVVVEHVNGTFVELVDSKVKSFLFGDKKFVRLKREDDIRRSISTGFFEVGYEGKTKLYIRHSKQFSELIRNTEIVREFDEKTTYYIVKNGGFYNAPNKTAVLQIFGDHKKEVKKFIRENNTFSKKERAASLAKLVQFYDSLNP